MNHSNDREVWPSGGIGNWGPATIGVPAEDFVGELQASQIVRACSELYAPGWHLEDVGSAGRVEHVCPIEEPRELLAVLAIANKAEAARRADVARYTAHVAALATKP